MNEINLFPANPVQQAAPATLVGQIDSKPKGGGSATPRGRWKQVALGALVALSMSAGLLATTTQHAAACSGEWVEDPRGGSFFICILR